MHRAYLCWLSPGGEHEARANRVPVGCGAVADQPDGHRRVRTREIVLQQADPRRRAVGDPHVKIAIVIPVDDRHRPGIIVVVDPQQGGGLAKALAFEIQIEWISFIPAKRLAAGDEIIEITNIARIARSGGGF